MTSIPSHRTLVKLLLMHRAVQMSIQSFQRPELLGAKETLVCLAIPRELVGGILRRSPFRSSNKSSGIGDNTVSVHQHDHSVDFGSGDTGRASARFAMEDEVGFVDKSALAVTTWTTECAG